MSAALSGPNRARRRELLAQDLRRLWGGPAGELAALSSATAEHGNQKPFAAAYLSSFPLGPELTSRPPESESSPEEETMLEAVANACVQPTFRSLLQGSG